MGEHNSPYFAAGLEDGTRDALAESSCPPQPSEGPDEERAWSWMYKRGYERGYQPNPCQCDGTCQRTGGAIGYGI